MTMTATQDKHDLVALQVSDARTEQEQFDVLMELERTYYLLTPSRQYEMGQQLLAGAHQTSNPELIARTQLFCANALYSQSKMQSALSQASEALIIAERFTLRRVCADAHETLGRVYEEIGIFAEALKHLLQALKLYNDLNYEDGKARTYIGIGLNYGRQGNHREAYRQFLQALHICERATPTTNPVTLTTVLSFLAHNMTSVGDTDQTLEYAQRLLTIAQSYGLELGISDGWVSIGNARMAQGALDEAEFAYARALDAAHKSEMQTQIAYIYKLIAELHYRKGEYALALDVLQQAAATAERSQSPVRILESYGLFPEIYSAAGRYEEATSAYKTYLDLRRVNDSEQQSIRASVLQTVYHVEQVKMETSVAHVKSEALLQEIKQRDQIITHLDSFAQQVAHDLKNPLNIVQNYTIMLQGDLHSRLQPDQQQMFDIMLQETQRMTGIITTMLEVARVRREDVLPYPIDMTTVVRSVIGRIKPLAAQYNAEISILTPLPMVLGITGWLEEVWFNYLSNAMKYGGIPPKIEIGATEDTETVTFWVRDNGNGIPPQDFPRLFGEFERLGQTSVEGHGVGLSIVKTIIEKLDGKVGAASSGISGEGATFSFTLPKPSPQWLTQVGA